MFNITGGEIIILLLLALIVLGPDKLPDFVRKAGRFYGEVKKMTGGFQSEFRSAIDEPLREMRDTANIARTWFEEGRSESDIEVDDDGATPVGDEVDIDDDWNAGDEDGDDARDEFDDEAVDDDPDDDIDDDAEADDDPNFYAEDGSLLDPDTISRLIAEAEADGEPGEATPPDETAPGTAR